MVTLLGATGTGKTMTMAGIIERVQRPTLVMAHNKTLAAQLCNEFRTFFPDNAVEYFVSYYDYYQPEAYVPSKDLYIEKDSAINQEVDRLRHAATAAVFARRDVIVVASRVRDLRPRLAGDVRHEHAGAQEGRLPRPRQAPAQARLDPVHAQRHGARPRHVPGARRVARGLPGLRRDRVPRDVLRRRDRAPAALRPAHRRAHRRRPRARRDLAGDALQRQGGLDRGRGRGDRARAQRAHRRARGRGQAARVAPPAPAHAVRHGDAAGDGLLQRHRELLADPRRPHAGRPAVLPARLLPGRLRRSSSTSRTRPCRRSAACTRATARASRRSSTTASGCRARSTTARRSSTSSCRSRRSSCSSRPRRASSSAATPRRSSSRSSARPASSTRRSRCARRATRSTTS